MLDDVELPHQSIAAPRASGVPAPGKANPNFVEDQPLLGFSGFTSEVQDKQPGPVGFDRAQMEVNPLPGDYTSPIPPLKRSTGPVEPEDILPVRIQEVEATSLFDQRASAMSPPSCAAATAHERFPS